MSAATAISCSFCTRVHGLLWNVLLCVLYSKARPFVSMIPQLYSRTDVMARNVVLILYRVIRLKTTVIQTVVDMSQIVFGQVKQHPHTCIQLTKFTH